MVMLEVRSRGPALAHLLSPLVVDVLVIAHDVEAEALASVERPLCFDVARAHAEWEVEAAMWWLDD